MKKALQDSINDCAKVLESSESDIQRSEISNQNCKKGLDKAKKECKQSEKDNQAIAEFIEKIEKGMPIKTTLAGIEADARQALREDITAPIVETLEKTNAILEKFHSKPIQIQFYPDDTPPDKIPDFDKDGFWVSQEKYADRTGKPYDRFSQYRENRYSPVRLPNSGILKIGNKKFGYHYCRQTGDQHNSSFEFFVQHDFNTPVSKRRG